MKNLLLVIVAFIGFLSGICGQIPTNGLIAYYPFSGSTGDSSGNGNHGVNHGASLTTDRFGNANSAYDFNGTSDYISVPNSSSLQSPTNALTQSVWVNVADLTVRHWVLDKRINAASAPYSSFAIYATDDTPSQQWNSQRTTSANSIHCPVGSNTVANVWTNIVSVYDGNQVHTYVNGSLQCSSNATGNILYSTLPLYIGGNFIAYHKGKIDDIRIYNTALTAIEVGALFDEGTVGINTRDYNSSIEIFPNPANDHFTVNFIHSPVPGHVLKITNVIGEVVFTTPAILQNYYIDLSKVGGSGIYFVQVSDVNNNLLYTRKMVLQ